MRYQVAALLTGVITVLALASAATFVWITVGEDDAAREQVAAEAEIHAVRAALRSRIQALQEHASALLQEQDVVTYAVREVERPDILELRALSRGGADYIVVSGPGRRMV